MENASDRTLDFPFPTDPTECIASLLEALVLVAEGQDVYHLGGTTVLTRSQRPCDGCRQVSALFALQALLISFRSLNNHTLRAPRALTGIFALPVLRILANTIQCML